MTDRQRLETITSFSLVCFVAGLLTLGVAVATNHFVLGNNTQTTEVPVGIPAPEPTTQPLAVQNPGDPTPADPADVEEVDPIMPSRLEIPRLSVDSNVEHVGYDDQGRMDAPQEWEDVAWFQYGFLPGAPGNAVIAGHLDSDVGPAVFAGLYLMEPGDEIYVTGDDDTRLTFVVTEVETVEAEDAPLDRVFGPSDTPQLNLITCEGHFDEDEEDYDHRLIVYTTLADAQ